MYDLLTMVFHSMQHQYLRASSPEHPAYCLACTEKVQSDCEQLAKGNFRVPLAYFLTEALAVELGVNVAVLQCHPSRYVHKIIIYMFRQAADRRRCTAVVSV